MALFNNAEGGVNGATVTTLDTGSGDPWTTVTTSGDAILIYTNTQHWNSTLSYRFATRSALADWLGWQNPVALNSGYGRCYFLIDGTLATANASLFQVRQSSAGFIGCYLLFSSAASHLRIDHGNNTPAYLFSSSISHNTWYRAEWFYTAPPGTTAGLMQARLYEGDSTSLIEDSGSVAVTATGAFSTFNFVKIGAAPNAVANIPSATDSLYMDNLAAFADDWLGPSVNTQVSDTPPIIHGRGAA